MVFGALSAMTTLQQVEAKELPALHVDNWASVTTLLLAM